MFLYTRVALLFGILGSGLILMQPPLCDGQQTHPLSPEVVRYRLQYDDHLLSLQKVIPEWRAAVSQIDPSLMTISYQDGRVIEQQKGIALQNLNSADHFIAAILARHRLSDEVSLFGLLGEVNSSIVGLGDDLFEFGNARDQKTIGGWADRLEAITSGRLNSEQIFQLGAVTAFADAMQDSCALLNASGAR